MFCFLVVAVVVLFLWKKMGQVNAITCFRLLSFHLALHVQAVNILQDIFLLFVFVFALMTETRKRIAQKLFKRQRNLRTMSPKPALVSASGRGFSARSPCQHLFLPGSRWRLSVFIFTHSFHFSPLIARTMPDYSSMRTTDAGHQMKNAERDRNGGLNPQSPQGALFQPWQLV